ncbi:MAG: DMT family transporter [Anaerolineales bacterium]
MNSTRLNAILLALLVTVLWSTSWVLIKIGLRNDLPPLSFAGMRYAIAALMLAPPVLFNARERTILFSLKRKDWLNLAMLGIIIYSLAQSAQFISLAYLPAAMVSLILNLSPAMVGIMSIFWWRERASRMQWFGIAITLGGTLLYFLPIVEGRLAVIGIAAALLGLVTNSGATLMGRHINLQSHLSPLVITFVSMGIGSALMLLSGGLLYGFGSPSPLDWGIIVWMALVNTAFAFTLWNKTQRTLAPVESSIILSLMMPLIALLAWVFLGETLTGKEIAGLVFVGLGVLIVQGYKV